MVQLILSIAKTVGVPGYLLLAICTTESRLINVMTPNDGGSATLGICQIKVGTAHMFGFKGEPKDLMVPKTNIRYAAKYLKYQLERYDNDLCKAIAAYNSGSYNPSTKVIGRPRNLKYIKRVAINLGIDYREICQEKVALK